jgi:hypothetical protein
MERRFCDALSIDQRMSDFRTLVEIPWPAMQEYKRNGIPNFTLKMHEVNVIITKVLDVDRCPVLREVVVERFFGFSPVETIEPIFCQLFDS